MRLSGLSACLTAALTVTCLGPHVLGAEEAHGHESGELFLRVSPGFGVTTTRIDGSFGEAEWKGLSGALDLAVGLGVARNLMLHASVSGWALIDPTLESASPDFPTNDLMMSLTCVGAGLTYYLGDTNLFLTGSLGFADISSDYDDGRIDSDFGLAVEGAIGKEWGISRRWAVGISGVVNLYSVRNPERDEDWSGASFGVRLTVTRN